MFWESLSFKTYSFVFGLYPSPFLTLFHDPSNTLSHIPVIHPHHTSPSYIPSSTQSCTFRAPLSQHPPHIFSYTFKSHLLHCSRNPSLLKTRLLWYLLYISKCWASLLSQARVSIHRGRPSTYEEGAVVRTHSQCFAGKSSTPVLFLLFVCKMIRISASMLFLAKMLALGSVRGEVAIYR